ncbi:ester cyclase [Chloroflexota bacterium]
MGIEENKEVVRLFCDRMSKGDASVIDELLTDNFVFHAMDTGRAVNRETLKQITLDRRISFPDLSITIDDIVAEKDRVSVRVSCRGIQRKQYGNIPLTNKNIMVARFTIYRLEDSKIAEAWNLVDTLGMYQQLGALPPTEEIGK